MRMNWNVALKCLGTLAAGFWIGMAIGAICHALYFLIALLAGKWIAAIVMLPITIVAMVILPPKMIIVEGPIGRFVDRFVKP